MPAFRLLVLLVLLAHCPLEGQVVRPQRASFQRLVDSLAERTLAGGRVAGLAIAVVRGADTLVMKGYGVADVENDVRVTPRSVFRIGSVTKQFTAAAVLRLVEQGRVDLEAEIRSYLPQVQTHGRRVLVRHLLNHTSGIPSYTDIGPAFRRLVTLDLPHDSLLAIVSPLPLMFEPGAGYYYNNTGYYLLGMLIEKVTGQSYGDALTALVLRPLGLENTRYCDTRSLIPHRVHGYEWNGSGLANAAYLSMGLPGAAGALCSTIGDLVAWTQALHRGRLLRPDLYRQMTTPARLTSGREIDYAYGLMRDTLAGRTVIRHDGGINGFLSVVDHYLEDSLTVVVLANTIPAPVSPLARDIASAWLGFVVPAPPTRSQVTLSAAERGLYVGEFALTWPDGVPRRLRIYEDAGALLITGEGQMGRISPIRLIAHGSHTFSSPVGLLEFELHDGRVTGFRVVQGARSLAGRRVTAERR